MARRWWSSWWGELWTALNATVETKVGLTRLALLVTLVGLAAAAQLFWSRAAELNSLLSYGAFVAVSIFSTQFWVLVIAYAVQLALLVALLPLRPGSTPRILILFAARVGAQWELHFISVAVAMVYLDWLVTRVAAALIIVLFGALLLEGPRRWSQRTTSLERLMAGRSLFSSSLFAMLGLLALWRQDWGQLQALLPSSLVVAGGTLVRTGLLWLNVRGEQRRPASTRPIGELTQRLVTVAVTATLMVPLFITLEHEPVASAATERDRAFLLTPREAPRDVLGAPVTALFIVADTQLHELRGARDAGHLAIIDDLVPVAVRPVELDLLSGVTLARFADVQRALAAARGPLPWVHLGDFGDLGCQSEIARLPRYLARFAEPPLALVPGNHDSTFDGNFLWHPDWGPACAGGIEHKAALNDSLEAFRVARGGTREGTVLVEHSGARTALARVVELAGGVRAIFLDTSDYTGLYFGAAGVQGAISPQQIAAVRAELARRGDPARPTLLFMHHPYDELSAHARHSLAALVDNLPTLIGVVSAHTHRVGCRNQTFAGRAVPELVVGSTIDPPQQAALLEVFAHGGTWDLRLRTLHAVARAREPKDESDHLDDAERQAARLSCDAVLAPLVERAACKPLLRGDAIADTFACDRGDDPSSRTKREQQWRAHLLLQCLGVPDAGCALDPGSGAIAALEERMLAAPADAELVCLSWAASLMQSHKKERWAFRDAFAFALDAAAAPAPKEIVVARELACQGMVK